MADRGNNADRVITLGCRLNLYESEVIQNHLDENPTGAQRIVVNTCAVTAEAERQAGQAIRRAARENPGADIVVTGCAAQIDPDKFAAMPEVSRVVGNVEKLDANTWGNHEHAPVQVQDIMAVDQTAGHLLDGFVEHTRAFVQVQQGCDHRCTFCTIPFGRGNSRSAPIGQVIEQVERLTDNGIQEVVLTGVDLTSFGPDLPGQPSLGQLAKRLLVQVPQLKRLRLSSMDSIEIDDDLLTLVAEEPRLMPHFHLSLQAGDDMVLKRMKRRHSSAEAVAICDKLRRLRPDIVFGADIIAGFPTETEEMFQRSMDLIDDCGLSLVHVFPYSERSGTPAARMPQVDKAVRKERAARLRAKADAALASRLMLEQGQTRSILMERKGRGHTEHFLPVKLADPDRVGVQSGTLFNGVVRGVENGHLVVDPA